jgi:hypothetical protein
MGKGEPRCPEDPPPREMTMELEGDERPALVAETTSVLNG